MLCTFSHLSDAKGYTAIHDTNGREYKVHVKHCVVTLNGKPARLVHLQRGDKLTIDGQPAVGIVATRG